MKFDPCELCGGRVKGRRVTVDHRQGEKLFVFRNVPIGVCSKCGERYYPGPTLERIEELSRHEELMTGKIRVPTFDFAEAG